MTEDVTSALPDEAVMLLLTLVALAAVWVPFIRGMRLCMQAWRATERLSAAELTKKSLENKNGDASEPVSVLMVPAAFCSATKVSMVIMAPLLSESCAGRKPVMQRATTRIGRMRFTVNS